jgi:cytoskeletal protein CcmA (bactofilin family)
MSTAPAIRSYEPEAPRGVATIGKAVYIKGQIIAREDLIVDGQVDGTVEAQEHRITIGPNGRVAATIKGRHIIIQGQVTGNVEGSEKVEIRNGAKLLGDVRTVKFVCEEEGTINGSVASLRPEPKPAAAATETKEKAAAASATQQTLTPTEVKK